jgi:hypothetical protein
MPATKNSAGQTFEEYCKDFPHVSEYILLREFEDASGDLRHSRLCVETGQWP